MKTFTTLKALWKNLSNNTSSGNDALAGQLISDQHRYLIQRWFDNERTYNTTTVGAQDLTLTGTPAVGATSATLTGAWSFLTCTQLAVFESGDQRTVFFTKGSTAITWQGGLTNTNSSAALTTVGVQAYPIPPNMSKPKNVTVTIGQLVYTPSPIQSVQDWTMLNALPYTSDIPNNFFIYNNQINLWPIPSSTGNLITINYKARVPNLSFEDYSTGTLSGLTAGSTQVTGVTTAWGTPYPLNVDLTFDNLFLQITPPSGEGIWYQIQSFQSNTALTLLQPLINVPSATASAYVIGQLPLLQEDFHDLIAYESLKIYFMSILKDADKFKMYEQICKEKEEMLKDYAGTKSVNVDLGTQPTNNNPNLFLFAPPQ